MKAIFEVGVDEAGRGPLAGPVSVGVIKVSNKFDKKFFRNIKDSKKLNAKSRESWFKEIKEMSDGGGLEYSVFLVSEKIIDKKGIVEAIKIGIGECFNN